jgi:hypothetical protein
MHDLGTGDRTSSLWLVTVAGLCRTHTGFADPGSGVLRFERSVQRA